PADTERPRSNLLMESRSNCWTEAICSFSCRSTLAFRRKSKFLRIGRTRRPIVESDPRAGVVRLAARLAVIGVGLAVALNLASCIEWGTNSQGQLQSIGLPGLPVWQSQTLTDQNRQASEGILAASPGTELDPKAANLASSPSQADWLVEVNRWRMAAGV